MSNMLEEIIMEEQKKYMNVKIVKTAHINKNVVLKQKIIEQEN